MVSRTSELNPRTMLAYAALLLSIGVAAIVANWLLQENNIERNNRIDMHINQYLMFGKGKQAYQFLREELQQGAPLLPKWLSLLRFEQDRQIKFSLLVVQLGLTPNREDLYRSIYLLLNNKADTISDAERHRLLVDLHRLDNLNSALLMKYQLHPPSSQ